MADTLIRNAHVYTGEKEINSGAALVCGDRIAWVGPADNCPLAQGADVIDARGMLLMPALYNAHTHSAMTVLRGVGNDLTLQNWLFSEVFPREDRMTSEIADAAGRLAMLEMIASGTVGFCDMYMFADKLASAAVESGMRAVICRPQLGQTGDDARPRFEDAESVFREFDGEGNVRVFIGPHAEYTTSPAVMRMVTEAAHKLGTGIHAHASETKLEHEACIGRHGKTPIGVFEETGLLDVPRGAVIAHAVWADERDMTILAKHKGRVAHCPVSNLKLASGIMPLQKMLDMGVCVGLGTDSVASNNHLDLFEEIKFSAILHKGLSLDPTAISAKTAASLASAGSAAACGFELCGELAAGLQADLILVDTDVVHAMPMRGAAGHIAYSARGADVRMTMCAGKILYRNGKFLTLDADKIKADFSRLAPQIEG